jgi:hypothetical protein
MPPTNSRPFDDAKFYRYADLEKLGFFHNWPSVRNWQENFGFPSGRLIGRTRSWTGLELNNYYESRPTEPCVTNARSPGRPRKLATEQSAA